MTAAYLPETEDDDNSDFEADGEDEIRELWEEAMENPEVLAGLSELLLLRRSPQHSDCIPTHFEG